MVDADRPLPPVGRSVPVHPEDSLRLHGSCVATGAFDGVHAGHRALVMALVDSARRRDVPAVIYTFDPLPRVALRGASQLISMQERLRRLTALGVDHIVLAHFTPAYAQRPPQAFVAELKALSPQALWVGSDFRFGRDRSGDITHLSRHFDLHIMPEVRCRDGVRVSSSRIRALMADGRKADAQALLGWPMQVQESP